VAAIKPVSLKICFTFCDAYLIVQWVLLQASLNSLRILKYFEATSNNETLVGCAESIAICGASTGSGKNKSNCALQVHRDVHDLSA